MANVGEAPTAVPRSDLVALLERATARKVTILVAPAGSGKSTLLREWAEHSRDTRRIVMVTVGRAERDLQQFWMSLLDAVSAAAQVGQSAALSPSPEFDPQFAMTVILDEMAAHGRPFVLVIDDLHELQAPEAFEQLERLLLELPTDAHAVLSGRRDPRVRLHQLRLAGELTEIRSADLVFDLAGSRALLLSTGVELPEPALRELLERTEGWAAGLRLAALALTDNPDGVAFVKQFSGSDRTVAEYLLAEVLERHTEEVRLLLLRTSILDRLNGPLADAVGQTGGGGQILHALESANAFVVAVDPDRKWFRYHHLFGDLLRLELRRTRPEELRELHLRAARWLGDHGFAVEAIRHAQTAEDWEFAARLLTGTHLSMMLDGQHALIRELLQQFPGSVRTSDLSLTLVAAFDELEQGSLDAGAILLSLIDAGIDTVASERRAAFEVARAVAGLLLARRRGDFSDVVALLGVLSSQTNAPARVVAAMSDELRVLALMNLGIAETWSLELEEAELHLEEAAALARHIGRPYLEVGCLAHLGFAAHADSFARARQRGREALALAEQHGWGGSPVSALALTTLGGQLLWSGDYREGAELLDRASTLLRDGEPATTLVWHLAQGNRYAAAGQWREALKEYRAAEQMQTLLVTAHALGAQATSFRIVMQIKLGHTDEAANAVAKLEAGHALSAESRVAVGLLRHANGDWRGALDAVAPAIEDLVPKIHAFTTVQANMIAASCHVELSARRESELAVERALALAEPDRLVFPFSIMPGVELLKRHPSHITAHAELLRTILDVIGGTAGSAVDAPVVALTEPLSASEERVLGYLPSNLSAAEIAGELVVSVNTVKTHMHHLYRKLDAHNRSEAVEMARRMGLLGRGTR